MSDEIEDPNVKALEYARNAISTMLEDDEESDVVDVNTDRATLVRIFHLLNVYLADDAYEAQPADFDRHIVIYGNPSQGFQVAGPFIDWDAAQDFGGGFDDTEWWVNKLAEVK